MGEREGALAGFGGILGVYEWLAAISDPTHEAHAEAKEWADEYDPDAVDELPIKYALSRIANRRNAAKARLASKKSPLSPRPNHVTRTGDRGRSAWSRGGLCRSLGFGSRPGLRARLKVKARGASP